MKTGAKNARMEKAIHTVRASAYLNGWSYREAWKRMTDEQQEGFAFAQVERHLETRVIL